MDSNLLNLGIFMVTGLKYLAQTVKASQENDNFLKTQIDDFIRRNEAFDISIKIDGQHINISYKGIFICRVDVKDYS